MGLLCAVIASAAWPAVPAHAQGRPGPEAARGISDLGRLSGMIEALVARVRPAVVQITTTAYVPGATAPGAGFATQQGTGSGVLVSADGYIVTNNHVVEGARRVQVVLTQPGPGPADPKSILKPAGKVVGAQVIGVDRESDVAVLKVAEEGLPFLSFGDSESLKQGQIVVAVGSPLGLAGSVTFGVVSAVARQIKPDDRMVYIQTDAPINPGNSGGPLLDSEARVVGLNSFILTQSGGSEGIGFAAPSNIVRNVFEQIRKTGKVHRGAIGVVAQTISPALAAGLGLPQSWGAVIADVTPGGPAASSGLAIGDVVLALNGKPVENARQLEVNLYPRTVGETVTLDVLRGTRHLSVAVPVMDRPGRDVRLAEMVTPERNLVPRLGILGLDLDDTLLDLLGPVRARAGVVVAAAGSASGSATDPLRAGDIIYSINQQPITGVEALRAALGAVGVGDPVVLQIERDGELRYLAFEMTEPALTLR